MVTISRTETAEPAEEQKRASRPRNIAISCAWVFCAASPVVASAALSWSGIEGNWFQRSGSLCVLFCVVLEIRQATLRKPVPTGLLDFEGTPALQESDASPEDAVFHWIARAGIVIGTLVWGYGDLVL